MKTPKEKYLNDPEYNHLVRTLESLIEAGTVYTIRIKGSLHLGQHKL